MSRLEEAAIKALVPQLEAEGFEIFLHPSKSMLPPTLGDYRPDAIAVRPDRKIAIEVIADGYRQTAAGLKEVTLQRLQDSLKGHPDWELRVIYAPALSPESSIPTYSRQTIEEHLARIDGTLEAMGTEAALLSAWAVFEAAARAVAPHLLQRPRPGITEALAREGYVTPDEADILRGLSRVRSEVAHGRLDLTPTRDQVRDLIRITRGMLDGGEGTDHQSPQTSPAG
ncbi:hypothetical protein [Paracraurococcus ruber]|nr:hypothetical protein [Paracraurococcus ruber]TDG25771.1 hypothetical protein E2C05_25545 [Paracraurococcus ruber]